MNYYRHNIGDYRRDTAHLSLLEHGVYRQAIDQYYLTENPLPKDLESVSRILLVRSPEEQKALEIILKEFFILTKDGYTHKRCEIELNSIYDKSEKARSSAKRRWSNVSEQCERNANAMRTQCERNANGMLPNTHNPIPNTHKKDIRENKFSPPTLQEVIKYCRERNNEVDPEKFIDFYQSKNWMIGKNKMKDWRASIRTWERSEAKKSKTNTPAWGDDKGWQKAGESLGIMARAGEDWSSYKNRIKSHLENS